MASQRTQDVIVFSGGGANAAYEVGVLKALLTEPCHHVDNSPIEPAGYTGTSLGAINAAVMAARSDWAQAAALDYLENLWVERIAGTERSIGNGLFRFRFVPFHYQDPSVVLANPLKPLIDLGGDSLLLARNFLKRSAQMLASEEPTASRFFKLADFSAGVDLSPLNRLIREVVDIQALAASSKKICITAANWEEGKTEPFTNTALAERPGYRRLEGEHGYQALVAASAIPGVVPSQMVDDRLFVDSAVLIEKPLENAIDLCKHSSSEDVDEPARLVIHVIYLDPELADVPISQYPDTFSTIYRLYALAFARSLRSDIEKAASVNERLGLLAGGSSLEDSGDDEYRLLRREMAEELHGKIEVTIHRHCPSKPAGGYFELLQFSRRRVLQQIQRGYEDTLKHDCEAAGCVLDIETRYQRIKAASN